MKLHLHIDRLVLPEGTSDDPERLAAAVRQALADMLGPSPAPDLLRPDLAGGAALPAVGPVPAPPLSSGALPRTIAGAILSTLRGPP